MLSFYDAHSVATSPAAVADPHLQNILAEAVHDWAALGLLDLTHVLVVKPGDTEEDIHAEVGFSPLVDPDGARFGSPDFVPPFDLVVDHDGWIELVVTVADSGFAFHLFVRDACGVDSALLALCRAHAREEGYCDSTSLPARSPHLL